MNFMGKMKSWVWVFALVAVMFSCEQKHDHKGKMPLVEVAGKFLYQEDLRQVLPLNLSKDDSVLFAESYIRNWVEDVLLMNLLYLKNSLLLLMSYLSGNMRKELKK